MISEALNTIRNIGDTRLKQCGDSYSSDSMLEQYRKELERVEQRAIDLMNAITFLEQNKTFEEFFKLMLKLR